MGEQEGDEQQGYRVLALDDDPVILRSLSRMLTPQGFEVATFSDPLEALKAIETDGELDLAIFDVNMPLMDGLTVLAKAKKLQPSLPVVMLTSDEAAETAVTALQAGAFNYLTKRHLGSAETVVALMTRAASVGSWERRARQLREQVAHAALFERLVGASEPMRSLYSTIDRLAQLDVPILLLGETGAGKELVARAIHDRSERASGPFVALNCAALPETMIDSELFGHTKGAFTGAIRARAGAFERANGGTLLLDEIGDISPAVQVRLLRVLQENEVQRVGGDSPVALDVRVITATLVDLEAATEAGDFRPDLFYRVNVVSVELPPLRHREGDVALLAAHFIKKHAERMGRGEPSLSAEVMAALGAYHWPGNVRELENAIQRALALTPGDTVELVSLPARVSSAQPQSQSVDLSVSNGEVDLDWTEGIPMPEARRLLQERFDRAYLHRLLIAANGKLSEAGRIAGVDRSNLRRLLSRYAISAADYVGARSSEDSQGSRTDDVDRD